jgi:hypothetical protein
MSDRTFSQYGVVARAAVVLVFATLAGSAMGAPPATPPTLTGEELVTPEGIPAGSLSVSATCNPSGTSTITYTASGSTPNFPDDPPEPYAGTFTESGTITIGPQTANGGPVLSWDVSFRITSGSTEVTGTKQLPRKSSLIGACVDNGADGHTYNVNNMKLDYTAMIQTANGTFRDSGRVDGELSDIVFSGGERRLSAEYFTSGQKKVR